MPFQKGPCGEGVEMRCFLLPLLVAAVVVLVLFLLILIILFFSPSSHNTNVNRRENEEYKILGEQERARSKKKTFDQCRGARGE